MQKSVLTKNVLLALLLLCLLVGVLVSAVLGLAATPGGTRWILGQVRQASDEALNWSRLEGSLLGTLALDGLRWRQPGLAVDVQALHLAWQPSALLRGVLHVHRVEVRGAQVAISDSGEPETPSEPFDPASLQPPLAMLVDAVEVRDLSVQSGDAVARRVERIGLAGLVWDRRLRLRQLDIRAPEGGLEAGGEVGLEGNMPISLQLAWEWTLPDGRGTGGQLALSGDAGHMTIVHRGRGDLPVALRGSVTAPFAEPEWDLALDWPQLALSADDGSPRIGPGQLQTRGRLDEFRLAGEGEVSGAGPEVLQWRLASRGDTTSLHLDSLALTAGPYQLALGGDINWSGPVTARLGYRARGEQLDSLNAELPAELAANGDIAVRYADDRIGLEELTLALGQAPLRLRARGEVQLPASGEPRFEGELEWDAVQWPLQGEAMAASPAGTLALRGTASDWRANLAARVAGSQLPPGQWRAEARGNSEAAQIETLRGDLLDGAISASGRVAWAPTLQWDLQLQGRGLDPGRWQPALPGRLALALQTRGRIDEDGSLRAGVTLEQFAGELAGRAIDLAARARLAGEQVILDDLDLHSGKNRFSASGHLEDGQLDLAWSLDVPEPATLLPGAGGTLAASGRVTGPTGRPRLRAGVNGQQLQWQEQTLSDVRLDLLAGLEADAPLELDVALGPLYSGPPTGQPLLSSATVRANGTTASHELGIHLEAPAQSLGATLTGGVDLPRSEWRGTLASLDLENAAVGPWQLAGETPLVLGAQRLSLGEACLQPAGPDGGPAAVCAGADWAPADGAQLRARVRELGLARLLPDLSGAVNGELQAAMAADGGLSGVGHFAISPGEIRVDAGDGKRLAHGGGELDLAIGDAGLTANLALQPLDSGQVRANLQLPALDRLPPAPTQPLAGRVQVDLPDLSGLQGWVPQLAAVTGKLSGELGLAGDLQQPRVSGQLALADAAADVPQAGLKLRDLALQLRPDPERPGSLDVSGGVRSGRGRLSLAGTVDPAGPTLDLTVNGERVEVYDTADARVLVSPDLRFGFSDEVLRLRGRVVVPEARITPQLGIRPGLSAQDPAAGAAPEPGRVIAPSGDVVILGEPREEAALEEPALPFRLDSQVELVLGEEVRVNALGFAGGIAGGLSFLNRPWDRSPIPIADGRLSVEGGTFRQFGQDLEIETGEVIFRQVPVTEPEVHLRAVRWIDNDPLVSAAGVEVSGPLDTPTLELFSRPQLDPAEIQSYLITGRPASSRETALSIGTYVHPKLYVGYGFNLLEETSEFDALYTITPRYGIEATAGEADNNLGVTFTYEH